MRKHMAWLNEHYAAGRFLVSGRQIPRTGGVIVALGDDRAEIEAIAAADPFVTGGVATVEVIQFRARRNLKGPGPFRFGDFPHIGAAGRPQDGAMLRTLLTARSRPSRSRRPPTPQCSQRQRRHAGDHRRRRRRSDHARGSRRRASFRSGRLDLRPHSRFSRISVRSGGGADEVRIDESGGVFTDTEITTIETGAGADVISGGSGAEVIAAGDDGDFVSPGAGDDSVSRSAPATTRCSSTRATRATRSRARAASTRCACSAPARPRSSPPGVRHPRAVHARHLIGAGRRGRDRDRRGERRPPAATWSTSATSWAPAVSASTPISGSPTASRPGLVPGRRRRRRIGRRCGSTRPSGLGRHRRSRGATPRADRLTVFGGGGSDSHRCGDASATDRHHARRRRRVATRSPAAAGPRCCAAARARTSPSAARATTSIDLGDGDDVAALEPWRRQRHHRRRRGHRPAVAFAATAPPRTRRWRPTARAPGSRAMSAVALDIGGIERVDALARPAPIASPSATSPAPASPSINAGVGNFGGDNATDEVTVTGTAARTIS